MHQLSLALRWYVEDPIKRKIDVSKKLSAAPSTSTSNQSASKELGNENIATHDWQVNYNSDYYFTSDDMFSSGGNITEGDIKTNRISDKPADPVCF